METDYAIIGGGVVGLSVAHGLAWSRSPGGGLGRRRQRPSCVPRQFRLGLGSIQGPESAYAYARWTRRSASLWREFADDLGEKARTPTSRSARMAATSFHFSDQSLEDRVRTYDALKAELDGEYPYEVLGHNALKRMEPHIGPKVIGRDPPSRRRRCEPAAPAARVDKRGASVGRRWCEPARRRRPSNRTRADSASRSKMATGLPPAGW